MDEQDGKARQCVNCRTTAPPTDTVHTLISGRFGWRCVRTRITIAKVSLIWYCPACWKAYKLARTPSAEAAAEAASPPLPSRITR